MNLRIGGIAWRLPRAGQVFVVMTLVVLLAAWNSGMNLLYLLVAGLFTFVVLSVFFSSRNLRGLTVVCEAPTAVHRGESVGIIVRVENHKPVLPAISLHIELAEAPAVLADGYLERVKRDRDALKRRVDAAAD